MMMLLINKVAYAQCGNLQDCHEGAEALHFAVWFSDYTSSSCYPERKAIHFR
jgi:hypothetical protein